MNPSPITRPQIISTVLIFVGLMAGFGVLSALVEWPGREDLKIAVLVALILAILPLVSPLLVFLQQSRAVVAFRDVKLDFSKAPRLVDAEPKQENLEAQPGTQVSDSNAASIADAAKAAISADIVVVDLGTGRSWYPSRLFALAAATKELDGAEAIVLLAQRGRRDRHFLGWLRPADLVRAMVQHDPRYNRALRRAKGILGQLQLHADEPGHAYADPFHFASQLEYAFKSSGDLALVPALIHELQETVPSTPNAAPIEDPNHPAWLTREDAERLFDPWLIRESLTSFKDDEAARTILARVSDRFVAVTENGRYLGMVDIDAYLRQRIFLAHQVDGSD